MRAPSAFDLLPEELLHEVFRQAGLHLGSGALSITHQGAWDWEGCGRGLVPAPVNASASAWAAP